MLEYYKLLLVKAGTDSLAFKKELRKALADIQDPDQRESLKEWFKNRSVVT